VRRWLAGVGDGGQGAGLTAVV